MGRVSLRRGTTSGYLFSSLETKKPPEGRAVEKFLPQMKKQGQQMPGRGKLWMFPSAHCFTPWQLFLLFSYVHFPLFFFFFFFWLHPQHINFPGQGLKLNPHCSSNPSPCSDNASSLTHCAARELLHCPFGKAWQCDCFITESCHHSWPRS